MPTAITLPRGNCVWLTTATGEVIDVSNTHVTSVSQGKTVVQAGYVIPGEIGSFTDRNTELWLRMPDGKERPIRSTNLAVPVRAGHQVSVALIAGSASAEGLPVGVRNHTTGETDVNVGSAFGPTSHQLKWRVGVFRVLVAAFALPIVAGVLIGFVGSTQSGYSSSAAGVMIMGGLAGLLFSPFAYSIAASQVVARRIGKLESLLDVEVAQHLLKLDRMGMV